MLFLRGGVIDSNFRGIISVILTNFSSYNVDIKKGDKIVQIMFLKKEEVDFEEVNEFHYNTVGGTKGFGSTDQKFVFYCEKKWLLIIRIIPSIFLFLIILKKKKFCYVLDKESVGTYPVIG